MLRAADDCTPCRELHPGTNRKFLRQLSRGFGRDDEELRASEPDSAGRPVIFDPSGANPVGHWFEQWLESPGTTDPFKALSQSFRAQAAYHRSIHDERVAAVCEEHALRVEQLVEAIRNAELDYDEAAAISPLERGTLKNKKPELDRLYGAAARGKVKVGAISLDPVACPGVHALRAADHLTVLKERKTRSTPEQREDDAWAHRAFSQGRERRR